jgi:hypothetical protein
VVVAVLYVGAASEVEMKRERKTELMMHYMLLELLLKKGIVAWWSCFTKS